MARLGGAALPVRRVLIRVADDLVANECVVRRELWRWITFAVDDASSGRRWVMTNVATRERRSVPTSAKVGETGLHAG